jgi:RHS repeat-associated protein
LSYNVVNKEKSKVIVKSEDLTPSTPTTYAYDGMYAVCEYGGHLDLESKYVYANGLLLARYDASGDTHYYHHDGLGSITGLTNENGALEQLYFYDEFGNLMGSWGGVSNHYLYTGQEYDGSITQMYNLRARYYNAELGRFFSEDPNCLSVFHGMSHCTIRQRIVGENLCIRGFASSPQHLNCYLYVLNNPMRYIDPTGERPDICYRQTVDWGELWRCLQEYYSSAEISQIAPCITICVLCYFTGYIPACAACIGCAGIYAGPLFYCIAMSVRSVPFQCCRPPLPRISRSPRVI